MRYQNTLLLSIVFLFVSVQAFAQPDADKPIKFKDQVFSDDVIVDGSICVGFDCVNGESFGFKTLRLKENNLRIHFLDTSTSASFPSADWCIQINDTTNGGGNYYGIVHENTGRRIFSLEANAPQHSLYVDDAGRVGFGTSNPVVELHVVDGNTPTLRLEQDGSSGFTPQTWDVAGNEAGFFVRDVTNGSTLPFRILPGASSQAFVIAGNDEIGIGAGTNPAAKFHIENSGGNDTDDFVVTSGGNVGIGTVAPSAPLHVLRADGNGGLIEFDGTSNSEFGLKIISNKNGGNFEGDAAAGGGMINLFADAMAVSGGDFIVAENRTGTVFVIEGNGRVGIGKDEPVGQLELTLDDAHKPGSGTWTIVSDKRLKTGIREFEGGLEEIMKINPVNFKYNGEGGIQETKKEFVGLIAQEVQEYAPYMIDTWEYKVDDDSPGTEYLNMNPDAVKYLLVNATQEQQAIIESQEERLDQLEKDNLELHALVLELKEALDRINIDEVNLEGQKDSYLRQNSPNPFDGQTSIAYKISDHAASASIQFSDVSGKLIKTVDINDVGTGIINLKADELPHGTYSYSLVVDGKLVETLQMVLVR